MPLISICIVAYNSEKTIQATLDSILPILQEVEAEIVFIDDGSTDQTIAIARKCLENISSKNKKIVTQENIGTAASRNRLIHEVTGDWIYFLDSDDLVITENFISVLPLLIQIETHVLRTGWRELEEQNFIDENFGAAKDREIIKYEDIREVSQKQNFVRSKGFWRYFYRKEFLKTLEYAFLPTFNQARGRYMLDDYYFLVNVADKISSIAIVNTDTYIYRDRKEGLSENYLMQIDRESLAIETFINCIQESGMISDFVAEELYNRFKMVSQIQIKTKRVEARKFKIATILNLIFYCRARRIRKIIFLLTYQIHFGYLALFRRISR